MGADEWLLTVTNEDVRAAKAAWSAARHAGAPTARVDQLYRGYERLVRTQARQTAEAFRESSARS